MTDDELLATIDPSSRTRNGVPEPELIERRARAAELAREALGTLLHPGGLRTSPLGPGWSSDIDAHVRDRPPVDELLDLGWLPLDGLLARVGIRERGRWAVVEGGEVIGSLDLHPSPPPEPVEGVLARCSRRGSVRLREVLELRALRRAGHALPERHPALSAAADVEVGLGGDVLATWATGRRRPCPAPVPRTRGGLVARGARRLRRRRTVVALSGADPARTLGLARTLVSQLEAAGVPAGIVHGGGIARVSPLARASRGDRALPGRGSTRPGSELAGRAGRGGRAGRAGPGVFAPLAGLGGLAGRGGLAGLLDAVRSAASARRRHREIRGVVVCAHHLLDPAVFFSCLRPGLPVLHRRLLAMLLPRPARSYVLVPPPEEAGQRAHDPAPRATAAALPCNDGLLRRHPEVVVLDAGLTAAEQCRIILGGLVGSPPRPLPLAGGSPRPRVRRHGAGPAPCATAAADEEEARLLHP